MQYAIYGVMIIALRIGNGRKYDTNAEINILNKCDLLKVDGEISAIVICENSDGLCRH